MSSIALVAARNYEIPVRNSCAIQKRYRTVSEVKRILQPCWKHMFDGAIGGIKNGATKKAVIPVERMPGKYIKQFFGHLMSPYAH